MSTRSGLSNAGLWLNPIEPIRDSAMGQGFPGQCQTTLVKIVKLNARPCVFESFERMATRTNGQHSPGKLNVFSWIVINFKEKTGLLDNRQLKQGLTASAQLVTIRQL